MPPKHPSEIVLREATADDAPVCGQICYDAFRAIGAAHGFAPDITGPEPATGFLSMMFGDPGFYCVVAENKGRIVGSNCLDERSTIAGVGPITVELGEQNAGAGRKLMIAVMDRAKAKGAAGIRLVQAAFHNRSLALYASLGFEVREPLACLQGRTLERSVPGCLVRAAQHSDLEACNAIAQQVHGFDRGGELTQAIQHATARIVERGGRITGYASDLAFFGHATAETNLDLQALIASAEGFGGPGILVPSRNAELFRWCLANGLRVVQPMTLMSVGFYQQPDGVWLPSVTF